jgi:succinoglycan biosynthesis transport protein ExoP
MRVTGPADNRDARSLGLARVLDVAKRRKYVALVVFVVALSPAVALAIWLPDLYRATATVLVETQQVSEEFVRSSVTSELGARIQRIRQEVMSRTRLGHLITELNLYSDLRSKGVAIDALVEQMRRDVGLELTGVDQHVGGRGPTIAFAINYTGRDPETVARVANTIATFYIDEHGRMRAGQAGAFAQFLKAQLAEAKRELDVQEQKTTQFKLSHLGELPGQIEANLGSLERLNTQLRLNNETQLRAQDRHDRLEHELTAAPPSTAAVAAVPPSPRMQELAKLKAELSELRRQYSDAYPDVIRIRAAIAALGEDAEPSAAVEKPAPGPSANARLAQSLRDIESELNRLKTEELSLRQAIGAYEQRVENMPRREEEFQTLSRDYATAKEKYDSLLKRYEEAQLAESLERGRQTEQFRILDPATAPGKPSAPARLRLIAAGVIFSLLLAVGATIVAEQLDTSFHTIEDLQSVINGRALFSIPLIQTPADSRRYWRRVAMTTVAVVAGVALVVAGFRHVATNNERVVRLVARGHQ